MRIRRRWQVLWRLAFTLGLAAGVTVAVAALEREAAARRATLPAEVGNFNRVRALLHRTPAGERYCFGVLGDTRNSGIYEALMGILNRQPLTFIVILGDFVNDDALVGEHHFFTLEAAEEVHPDVPTFLVVGNHDVGPAFTMADFEARYGPSQFLFRYGSDLFIVLRYIPTESTAAAEAFLDEVLTRERASARNVFVFTHAPPISRHEYDSRTQPADPAIVSLCEKHRVTMVISGHEHAYARLERNGVRYVISGGGGGRFDEHGATGRFHHALVFDVGPEGVDEHVFPVTGLFWHNLEDKVELWAVAYAGPWIRRWWPVLAPAGLLWLALVVPAWRSLRRRRAAQPRAAGPQVKREPAGQP